MPLPDLSAIGGQLSNQTVQAANLLNCKNQTLDIDNIKLNPKNTLFNKNDTEESIEELAASIDLVGLQNPLIVVQQGRNEYMLLAGERRLKAVKILKWKSVPCKIYSSLSDTLQTIIRNDTNLSQRSLTDEQKFNGYREILDVLKDDDNLDKSKIKKMLNLSSYKVHKYDEILKNIKSEDLQKYDEGTLNFSELKESVAEQKKINDEQKKLDEAVRIYAQKQESPDTKFYIDRDKNLIYRVDLGTDNNNKQYFGVKAKNYTNNLVPTWVRSTELPQCDNQKTMQIFLDKYAITHGIEECSVDEYVTLIKDKHEKEKVDDKKALVNTNLSSNTMEEKQPNNSIPQFNQNSMPPDDSFDDELNIDCNDFTTSEEFVDLSKDNEDNKFNDTAKRVNEELLEAKNKPTKEDKKEKQIDILKNTYSLNVEFVGKEIESNKMVKGHLLVNKKLNRYFIQTGNVSIEKSVQQSNKLTAYSLHCVAYEVNPNTIKTV